MTDATISIDKIEKHILNELKGINSSRLDDLDVENAAKLFNMGQKIVDYVGNNEAPLESRIKLYDFAEEYKFSDKCLSNPHDLNPSSEADNDEDKGHHNNPL